MLSKVNALGQKIFFLIFMLCFSNSEILFATEGLLVQAQFPNSMPSPTQTHQATVDLMTPEAFKAEAQKNLGDLEVWQKTLFDLEVVPQSSRFIKGRDLNLKDLRQFLAFYAPKVETFKEFNFLVFVSSMDSQCQTCADHFLRIKSLLTERLTRRGLIPVWISEEELEEGGQGSGIREILLNKSMVFQGPFEDRLQFLLKKKQAIGFLVMRLTSILAEDLDSTQSSENKILIDLLFQFSKQYSQIFKKEISENESIESSALEMLTDVFLGLGEKVISSQNSSKENDDEILIEVYGLNDYSQYLRVKSSLQNKLGNTLGLESKKFSKNQIVFSIHTQSSIHELKRRLGGTIVDPESNQPFRVVVTYEKL